MGGEIHTGMYRGNMLACIEDIYQYVFQNILVYIGGTYWYVLAILFGMFLGEMGGGLKAGLAAQLTALVSRFKK
jgi:uncharacterized membrane protein YccC